jgi:hypothetical protein
MLLCILFLGQNVGTYLSIVTFIILIVLLYVQNLDVPSVIHHIFCPMVSPSSLILIFL